MPFNLVTNILGSKLQLALLVAAALAVGSVYLYIKHLQSSIEKLEGDNIVLKTNNQVLKDNVEIMRQNVKELAKSNHENWKTVQSLLEERKAAQQAINNLAVATKNDREVIARLNKRLNDIIKDPSNDGVVAPALRETVRDVQETRRKP